MGLESLLARLEHQEHQGTRDGVPGKPLQNKPGTPNTPRTPEIQQGWPDISKPHVSPDAARPEDIADIPPETDQVFDEAASIAMEEAELRAAPPPYILREFGDRLSPEDRADIEAGDIPGETVQAPEQNMPDERLIAWYWRSDRYDPRDGRYGGTYLAPASEDIDTVRAYLEKFYQVKIVELRRPGEPA